MVLVVVNDTMSGQKEVENVEVPGQGMQRVQVLPLRISVGFSGEFTDHKQELFIGTLFV